MTRRRVNLSTAPLTYSHPANRSPATRVLIGTATLGKVTIEWANAVNGWIVPPNWSSARVTPKNYHVWDAQNIVAFVTVRDGHDWLFLLEDDTVPMGDCLLKADAHMLAAQPAKGRRKEKGFPIVSGLYYIKNSLIPGLGPEPLVYRGSGQRAFWDWTPGELVRCDGVPTGALLVHRRILEAYLEEPDLTWYQLPGVPHGVPKIFQAPAEAHRNGDGEITFTCTGTSDLYFCDQVRKRGLLAKAGWPELQKHPHPFVVDTSWKFHHQDRQTGIMYPQVWPNKRPRGRRRAA